MKVIVRSESLQNIADAIRTITGQVRVFKAREMAPAIDQIPAILRDVHSYRVTINQSPHQRITVRRYLPEIQRVHNTTFTVSEQFYWLDISIEADEGYRAGTLNLSGTIQLDRDRIIEATPAIQVYG